MSSGLNKVKFSAAGLISRLNGISFKEAITEDELDLVYKLRYEIYLGEGFISKNDNGRFKDIYDNNSINFLIYRGKIPIGTFRMILNSDAGFWTEAIFNFNKPAIPRNQIAEISRVGIIKETRGGRAVMLGLIDTVYKKSGQLGITHIYFNTPARLAQHITSFGVPIIKLEEFPPTPEVLEKRKLIDGYFKKAKLEPYLIELNSNKNSRK